MSPVDRMLGVVVEVGWISNPSMWDLRHSRIVPLLLKIDFIQQRDSTPSGSILTFHSEAGVSWV